MNNLGEKIYWLRKQKGLSQEELGFALDVSRQTISKWETGLACPDAKNLIQLSEFFHITVESLYAKEDINLDENASTSPPKDDIDKKQKKKKYKTVLLKIFLTVLIFLALGLILMLVVIGYSIYSSSANQGVESVSLVLFNLSQLDVLFICLISFLIVLVLIVIIAIIIHKTNIKK